MNKWAILLVVVGFLAASCIVLQPAKAYSSTVVVPDVYATIQKAVDAAVDGDCIYVRNGVYHENVLVNKSISLIGEDWERTVIDGNWSQNYLRPITIIHNDVTVRCFALVDSWQGVCLDKVSGCNISGNKILNNHYSVVLTSAIGNSITENVISSVKFGAYGIQLNQASNNSIQENQLTNLSEGVVVIDEFYSPNTAIISKSNNILENNIANCSDKAVWLKFTKENLMARNTIANSTIGLALMWTDNNVVYHNNFIGNAEQVAGGPEPIWSGGSGVRYSICQWDNGGEGNFWSDYNGTDVNSDGIGDTPYVVNEKNTDNFPLVNPTATYELTSPAVDANFPSPTASAPVVSPTVAATSPSPEPFPIVPVIVGSTGALVVVVGAGLSVYHKKHRH